jgi:hypothetical protein
MQVRIGPRTTVDNIWLRGIIRYDRDEHRRHLVFMSVPGHFYPERINMRVSVVHEKENFALPSSPSTSLNTISSRIG